MVALSPIQRTVLFLVTIAEHSTRIIQTQDQTEITDI